MPVPHSPPWLRFQSPLSEPDRRISRIRLSSGIMRFAHGTPWQPRAAGDRTCGSGTASACGARRFQWTAEPVDASTTPRLSSAVPSLGHVMLPGFPVFFRGNRHSHSRDPSPFGHRSSPEAPSLRRRYPASQVIWASPPPSLARPDPRGLSVGACHATSQGFPCCVHSPLPCVLPPLPRRNLSVHASLASPTGVSLPRFRGGSASALRVSRPARRLLTLRPAWSLSRPWRPVTSECFRRCRYLPHPLRLLPAGVTVAGRDSHPLWNGAFHGAHEKLR